MARSKRRQLAIYLDEGVATLGAWAKHRGFVTRDIMPYGSEPGFPGYAEKYQDRFYYRIEDLDVYFANKPDFAGITSAEADRSVKRFLATLKNINKIWA